MTRRRAVFLDRDGVLNRAFLRDDGKTHPPAGPGDLQVLPGVPEACHTLRGAGFLLIVVTNQPDVARGAQRRETVEAIHDELRRRVPVDDIRACYHDDADGCCCRKPRPGLLLEAARDWAIDLAGSFVVGDRWTDVEAGRRAGCTTVLVDGDFGQGEPGRAAVTDGVNPDHRSGSLAEAAAWIVRSGPTLAQGGDQE